MRPDRAFVLPLAPDRVHRIEIRMALNQALYLLLGKVDRVVKQLSIRLVDELDHFNTRDDNYK